MVDSTVNHYHCKDDTTIIRMALSKEIQGFRFYVWFVGQIVDSNGCTFAFSEYNINACIPNGQERVAVQK